jgi:hypothetical protein
MGLVAALIVLSSSAPSDASSLFFLASDDLIDTNSWNDFSTPRRTQISSTAEPSDSPDLSPPSTDTAESGTSLFVIAIVVLVALVLAAIVVCTCWRHGKRRAIAHLAEIDERVDEPLLVPAEFF